MTIKINKRTGIVTTEKNGRIEVEKSDKWLLRIEQDIWFESVKSKHNL